MNQAQISQVLGEIHPRYVEEAAAFPHKAKRALSPVWMRFAAAAAGIALLIVAALHFSNPIILKSDESLGDSVQLIEYENAYWEIIESPEILEKRGLPQPITKSLVGAHLAYLEAETPEKARSNYQIANQKTDAELLEYAPAPCRAVRLIRVGETYSYALFSSFHVPKDQSLWIGEALALFGIESASDIRSITFSGEEESGGREKVVQEEAIAAFYRIFSRMLSYSQDDYEEKDASPATGMETLLAAKRGDLILESKEGLRFVIPYSPASGFLYLSETLSYYQISPELQDWFSDNFP